MNLPFVKQYVYGSNEQINEWIHQHYGTTQLLDVGIVGLGVFFVLFGIFSQGTSKFRFQPLYLGQVMILLGIFFRVSLKGIPIHWMSEYTRDFISYLTFFSLSIPMFVYLAKRNKTLGIFSWLCHGFAIIQLIVLAVAFVLHGLGIRDISHLTWSGAVFWFVMTLFALVGSIAAFARW